MINSEHEHVPIILVEVLTGHSSSEGFSTPCSTRSIILWVREGQRRRWMRKVRKKRKRRRREEEEKGAEKKERQEENKKRDTEVSIDASTRHRAVLTCLPLTSHAAPHPRKVLRSELSK